MCSVQQVKGLISNSWNHKSNSIKFSRPIVESDDWRDWIVFSADLSTALQTANARQTDENGKVVLSMVRATTDEEEYFDFVYPNLDEGKACATGVALLTLRNMDVDKMNEAVCERLKGTSTSLFSHDELDASTEHAGETIDTTKLDPLV